MNYILPAGGISVTEVPVPVGNSRGTGGIEVHLGVQANGIIWQYGEVSIRQHMDFQCIDHCINACRVIYYGQHNIEEAIKSISMANILADIGISITKVPVPCIYVGCACSEEVYHFAHTE